MLHRQVAVRHPCCQRGEPPLRFQGCPLLGDPLYANPKRQSPRPERLMLHAWRLGFTHPDTGQFKTHEAPPPPEFEAFFPNQQCLDTIRNTSPDALPQALNVDGRVSKDQSDTP